MWIDPDAKGCIYDTTDCYNQCKGCKHGPPTPGVYMNKKQLEIMNELVELYCAKCQHEYDNGSVFEWYEFGIGELEPFLNDFLTKIRDTQEPACWFGAGTNSQYIEDGTPLYRIPPANPCRLNVEKTAGGVRVCWGEHDKSDDCQWEYFWNKQPEKVVADVVCWRWKVHGQEFYNYVDAKHIEQFLIDTDMTIDQLEPCDWRTLTAETRKWINKGLALQKLMQTMEEKITELSAGDHEAIIRKAKLDALREVEDVVSDDEDRCNIRLLAAAYDDENMSKFFDACDRVFRRLEE